MGTLTGTCQCGARGPIDGEGHEMRVRGCRCDQPIGKADRIDIVVAPVEPNRSVHFDDRVSTTPKPPRVAKPRRARGGGAAQRLLKQHLDETFIDVSDLSPLKEPEQTFRLLPAFLYVREFSWALDADPPREFRADFAIPWHRLLVEIDGGAHRASRAQLARDTERRRVAVACGWAVLPFTPEEVRDRKAIDGILDFLRRCSR